MSYKTIWAGSYRIILDSLIPSPLILWHSQSCQKIEIFLQRVKHQFFWLFLFSSTGIKPVVENPCTRHGCILRTKASPLTAHAEPGFLVGLPW